ncbi:MAG: HAMP domain-containing protein [bacterium]|nr:HAMP domain-containing protein [bacterium]
MSRIQLKIMGALALLIVVVISSSGFLAERTFRERTTSNMEANLEHQANLVAQLVQRVGFDPVHAERLQGIAFEGSASIGARITLIDPSGLVLADSEVSLAEISGLTNHSDRPEIVAALHTGVGHSIRRSDTLKRSLLYVAVRVPDEDSGKVYGVVRLSVFLDQLEAAIAELRKELIVASLVGLVAALGLSYALSLLSLRPIRELREVVADIAEGKLGSRLNWASKDERGEIAASINLLARQMRASTDEVLRERVQLEAVVSSMVEGVIVIDREGKVLLVNPRAREMLSVWGKFHGRPVPEIIRSPEIIQALHDAATGNEIVVRELEVQAEKNRVLLMHASGFPATSPRSGTVAVFHDVSELRRVDEVRRDFIANASHELRTPLTAIQGFAHSLSGPGTEVSPEELSHYLDVIVRNAQRMSNLIDDLLTLSRIESGTTTLEFNALDVPPIIESVVADFGPRFQEAAIELKLHANQVPRCYANRGALEQILSNLLSNAARYSNPGSRVDVYCEQRGIRLEIRVADTGIGIPEGDRERIFERFYRVDAARSRALGSTGLGLSIVRHLVRAMDGQIHLTSEVGKGSTFSFTLPIAEASDAD